MALSGSNIQNFLIFSQKKAFKNSVIQETELFYISRNVYIFQEVTIRKSKKNHSEKNIYILGNGTF